MLVRALLALAVATAAGYLLFRDTGSPAPAVKARAKPPVLTLDRPIEGTLHFTASLPRPGGGAYDEESVYRLGAGDERPVRVLPENVRTWHVSAWDGNVVVNTESGGERLAPAGAVQLHPSGRSGRPIAVDAHLPAAGPAGRVAYQGYVRRRSVSAVFVRWSRRGRFRPVARGGIWATDFLPDGRLVVVQRRSGRAWIMVFSPRGLQHEFPVPGNPQADVLVTRGGLIGFEGATGRLRLYTPSGRRRGALDMTDWLPAGTRGTRFLLVEREGDRIASISPEGDLQLLGRFDPAYDVFHLEWEPR